MFERFAAIPIKVTNGGPKAASAIKNSWPTSKAQRRLLHIQRVVRRHTTSRRRINAERAIYQLGLNLTKIHTLDAVMTGRVMHRWEPLVPTWQNEVRSIFGFSVRY
ncbi:hypothetical protein [Corynebacterium auris]|uniref:hypothetical protein n=1 Tax=Corynebacterium auris TaxID=44750 RepID=UPI003F492A92